MILQTTLRLNEKANQAISLFKNQLLEVMVILKMQPFNRKYVKPLLAGLIMVLISLLVNLAPSMGFIWVLYSGILTLVYGGLLYLMGFEEEDRAIFSMVKKRIGRISS